MNDCIFWQNLFTLQMTSGTNYAIIRDGHTRCYRTFTLEHILFADFRCFDGAAHLEYIVRSNQKYWRLGRWFDVNTNGRSMGDGRVFFDQTVLADDDWSGFGDNCDTRMNDAAARNGYIAEERALIALTYDCLWHDFQTEIEVD